MIVLGQLAKAASSAFYMLSTMSDGKFILQGDGLATQEYVTYYIIMVGQSAEEASSAFHKLYHVKW